MITHIGWAVFIGSPDNRQYLEVMVSGTPRFTADPSEAKFFDEIDARKTCVVLCRQGHAARVQYIPFSVRKMWNRTDVLVWAK